MRIRSTIILGFFLLAAGALLFTWREIFLFLIEDATPYASADDWIEKSEFFVKVNRRLLCDL